jgi:hypothetical protein
MQENGTLQRAVLPEMVAKRKTFTAKFRPQ